MRSAIYGRMRPGKCITADYAHTMNCQADVLSYMDTHCSGRITCEVVVGTLDQVAQPCHKDFKSYLLAYYECKTGEDKLITCLEVHIMQGL